MTRDSNLASSTMRFTILGCGSSPGVPRIGNDWGNCDPANPNNRRRRASLLIERIGVDGTTTVVVDAGPDFREQMLSANVTRADGVVFTHAHADHIHGLDDLRGFFINTRERVEVYADQPTSQRLHEAFGYCFKTPEGSNYPAILKENRITADQTFHIDGKGGPIALHPFHQSHGSIQSLGFRIESDEGTLAYCSDVSGFSDDVLSNLENLDVLIIDALQYREHPSHFSLQQSLDWISRLKPAHAVLTHMHTPLDYDKVMAETPDNVEPAFDGLVIGFR